MSTPPPLRLDSIRICGYRAFPHPVEIPLKGKSLVLYGENGSGKSSLGKAVRDFLDYRAAAVPFGTYQYRHANPPREDRCVTLTFTDGAKPPLVWTHEKRDAIHTEFRDMARSRGWLDYRVVWRASEVQYGDSVEIFRALVEDILPGCQRGASNETFGQAWDGISIAAAKGPTRGTYTRFALELLLSKIKTFNESLQGFLPELEKHANELLAAFVPWTTMELSWASGATYDSSLRRRDKFHLGSIRLKMRERGGHPLKTPSEFLNEARVTAIGLCLYLAGMARSIPPMRSDGTTYPRLLILDDVLLSLDMAHRLPLLRILRERFDKWQVLLLTHDRAWYEIAKQQLTGWAHHELFTQQVGDYEQPMSRADQDHLGWAIDFLVQGHVKAAAVHVRSKFEEVLKWACQSLGIAVKYHPDPRKVSASDFWAAVSGATYDNIPPVASAADAAGKLRWWQPRPDTQSVVSTELKERITHALSWVLNPLSHSQSVDRYRGEIEDAIFAVNELEQAIRRAIAIRQAGSILFREMLLHLMRSRK
jgi:energy-coupling factor transporter ATP-binding protein EcfA2